MRLIDLQQTFQRALLGETGETEKMPVPPSVEDGPRADRSRLFGVYHTAYRLRLIGVLKADYERLNQYLGDEPFETLARAYIDALPSRHPNARYVGDRLPDFLASDPRYAAQSALHDLARIEHALAQAFDAADAANLTVNDLTDVAPEIWPDLVFIPHPSAQLLALGSNALDLWQALCNGAPPPEALAVECFVLVWRRDFISRYRRTDAVEAMAWRALMEGATFATLCDLLAQSVGPDEAAPRAAGLLRGWVDAGLLSGMST